MKHPYLAACALLTAVTASLPAFASHGYVPNTVNLRAGPGTMYPIVNSIPGNVIIDINGCLRDKEWCDVTWSGKRKGNRKWVEHGWVSERFLQAAFRDKNGQYAIRPDQKMRVPVVSFDIVNYWDAYYRDEYFYRDRQHYIRNNNYRNRDNDDRSGNDHRSYNSMQNRNRSDNNDWSNDREWDRRQNNDNRRDQNYGYYNYWND